MTVPNLHNAEPFDLDPTPRQPAGPVPGRGDGPGFLLSATVGAEILAEGADYRRHLEAELRRIDADPAAGGMD